MTTINRNTPIKFGSTEWKDVFMIQKSHNPDTNVTIFVGRLNIPPMFVDRQIDTSLLNTHPDMANQMRDSIEREVKRYIKEMIK